jgi:pimeloyl-ACP methyl ester carboxylesterase
MRVGVRAARRGTEMVLWQLIRLVALAGAVLSLAACQSNGLGGPPKRAENLAFGHPTAYEPEPCWFEVSARHPISCGQLLVPEDWTADGSRQLHLPVVVFHTASGRDPAEPIVYLTGGPGGHSGLRTGLEIERWLDFLDTERWTRAHDVIVIAQRGTSWIDSDLSCPALSDPMFWSNAGATPDAWIDRRERLRDAVIACREQLIRQGHALGAYNSTQSALDVAALRPLLALDSWSLYGVSYGTRFALTVMRNHPEGIRSAILDSPYPPQLARLGVDAAGFEEALDQVLDACAADALCRAHYPDLRSHLAATLAGLAQTPLPLQVTSRNGRATAWLTVDDIELLNVLLALVRDHDSVEQVPGLIEEIRERPNAFAARYQEALFGDPGADSAEGAYLSIFCNDDHAALAAGYWEAEAERHPLLRAWLLARPGDMACDLWPVTPIDPRDKQPVVSDIPTLILAGGLDPTTPPAFAHATATTLRRAHVFVFPGVSHGVLAVDSCASEVVEKFLAQPEARPDVDCPGVIPEFSPSINARAAALLDEGRNVEAEELLQQLLAAQERTVGAGHRNVGITANHLGRVYLARDLYDQAERFFKKALAINWKTRGQYDLNTAASAFFLAWTYQSQGRHREAEPLYRRALRIEEVAHGSDHPDLAITLEAYASVLRELGRDAEAGQLEARAAAMDRG